MVTMSLIIPNYRSQMKKRVFKALSKNLIKKIQININQNKKSSTQMMFKRNLLSKDNLISNTNLKKKSHNLHLFEVSNPNLMQTHKYKHFKRNSNKSSSFTEHAVNNQSCIRPNVKILYNKSRVNSSIRSMMSQIASKLRNRFQLIKEKEWIDQNNPSRPLR